MSPPGTCSRAAGGRGASTQRRARPPPAMRAVLVDIGLRSDVEHVAGLITPPGTAAPLGLLELLALADHRQQWSEALVVDDGGLLDVTDLVEGPIGEVGALVADGQATIGIVDDGHAFADRGLGFLGRIENEHHLVVLKGERLRQRPLDTPGEGVLQTVACEAPRSPGVMLTATDCISLSLLPARGVGYFGQSYAVVAAILGWVGLGWSHLRRPVIWRARTERSCAMAAKGLAQR
jgi:hypothetical protein